MNTEPDQIFDVTLFTDVELEGIAVKPLAGMYLVPARTGKGWFHVIVGLAHSLMFIRNQFTDSGESVVVVAIGDRAGLVLESRKSLGFLVRTGYEDKT